MSMIRGAILTLLIAFSGITAVAADQVIIKLGTVAPEGSVWHDALLQVRQEWRSITNGEVELRVYAGGILGGEVEMVRKLQRRGLDAVAMTGVGLPQIDQSVDVLNIPMLFDSYDELDYVRSKIAPEIERRLETKRFKVLTWADAGWVYFFTKSAVRTPDDIRSLRLWVSAGDPRDEKLYKEFGFAVVPLPLTDMLTALQTGLVEAIDVPPLYALLDRSYQVASFMTDIRWAPLNAATVISLDAWARIPAQYHDAMLVAIRRISDDTKEKIRSDGEQAIAEMQARGLKVVDVSDTEREEWRRETRDAYPRLRANIGMPALFDEVLRLAAEYKTRQSNEAGLDLNLSE